MARSLKKKPVYSALRPVLLPALTLALGVVAVSCGSPDPSQEAGATVTDVKGVAGFQSQCPYGSEQTPFAVKLSLYNCPIGLDQVELDQPIEPQIVQVDCKKKQITIRRPNHAAESTWNMMPDGSFSATVDGGMAHLKSDGPGHSACSAPLAVDITGKVDCNDRDRVDIPVEAVYWIGKTADAQPSPSPSVSPIPSPTVSSHPSPTPTSTSTPRPTPSPSHSPGGFPWPWLEAASASNSTCHVPTSCYFYASATIKQCQ